MKVHYINILLFALPLNILVTLYHVSSPHKKPSITLPTPHTQTNRTLCECDIYIPNYDNDPQMKKTMEIFNEQTQQRFHEYDDRMKTTRQKCKDKCDKEIQKIILKDKLEKQMAQQFVTLETKIDTNNIPTCICEKSLADKTEQFCLNCGKNMGAIAPWWGLVCGTGYAGWLNFATASAIEYATKKGIEEGVKAAIAKITGNSIYGMLTNLPWSNFINGSNYSTAKGLFEAVTKAVNSYAETCPSQSVNIQMARSSLYSNGQSWFNTAAGVGKDAAADKIATVQTAELGKVTTQSTQLYGAIGYSVLAIIIIILIMVIIYLILRHRRKKKMKKKLQYIKLLEE
ncbi:rifin PIR protein, putative [Plasmodium reichenowi]|uniref:Rifin PIR protein, putative n=1 Tax=Plasmodium reichenowi TaxID=5854 RepID=A0A2P9D8G9_PLARE|nr:rifin PIR protein, putative [Plasmodium reichenowi]